MRFALVVAVTAMLYSCTALAFTRSRDPDSDRCLYWRLRTVTYYLNSDCSVDVEFAPCQDAVNRAYDAWNGDCTDFLFVYGGTTSRRDVGFDETNWDDNINLVVWQESSWSHGRTAIALTTTTYDTLSGEIVDADIEVNGQNFTFSTTLPAATDIQNTLVHEAGHVQGLDHSINADASMYAEAKAGETTKRDISVDDRNGMCFVYPTGESTPDTYPLGGDLVPCGEPPPDNGCCRTTGGNGTGCASLVMLALALALGRSLRRRGESGGTTE